MEKKLLISLLFLFLTFVVLANNQTEGFETPVAESDKKLKLVRAKNKIAGEANWRPEGYGDGEYLETIPTIEAGAVINIDSGKVIWSKNLKKKISPASLTKLATVMTAMDIEDEGKKITVTDDASSQIPTKIGLKEGERLTLEEAAAAAILTSANDAAEAISDGLGEEIGDGTKTFMELVNLKVEKIGTADTNFENSTGLDGANHYSTVYDLAIIGYHAKKNYPKIAEYASASYRRLEPNGDHKLFDLPNWNALLGTYPGVNGLKIGFTEKAGHTTMVTAERDGKNIIAIVIGAETIEDREMAAAALLNYGFSKEGIAEYPLENLDLLRRFDEWRRQLSVKDLTSSLRASLLP